MIAGNTVSDTERIGAARTQDEFALYVHWPFCLAKCPYCDFNSHVRDSVEEPRFRRALLAELDHYALEMKDRTVTSLFFGGGTPSLMSPATVGAVIERAALRWGLAADVEITLEANPSSVEAARFAGYRAAGVNRISLGVQALDEAALGFLGRRHSAAEALKAISLAKRTVERVSFDLIYARPGQTVAAWREELGRALCHAGEHISVYQLTIERGTPFYAAHGRGEFALPDEDLQAALFETTEDVLAAAGLPAYEISNHARPGAECRHNLAYWRSADYMGVGPGAHGRFAAADGAVWASRQIRTPEAWLAAVEARGHGLEARETVSAPDRLTEVLMMGLRLSAGIDRGLFRCRTGLEFEASLDGARLARLVNGGFLVLDAIGLRATAAGRQRLNAVLAALLV